MIETCIILYCNTTAASAITKMDDVSYSLLVKSSSKEQVEVILNMVGNIISGQVTGESAKALSDRFGKNMQKQRRCCHQQQ